MEPGRMQIRIRQLTRALIVAGALLGPLTACTQDRGGQSERGAAPQVWEPIDKDFKGCEGG
jgi:hypothetical protein